MDIFANTINQCIAIFSSYIAQFLAWGQLIFYSLLTINIVWLTLWYAFDKNSFVSSIADFIKRFFVIALFYTIMTKHNWLIELLQTADVMGQTLTKLPLDPIAIIANGIVIANKIVFPLQQASLLTAGFGLLVAFTAWLTVTFSFIGIALYLSLTLITTTALIVISTFFLGFGALNATHSIARRALDAILTNCVKLLGTYLAVGVGAQTIEAIAKSIPEKLLSFDAYTWIIAACLLLLVIVKKLPEQLARVVSGCIQEEHNTDNSTLAVSALHHAQTMISNTKIAAGGATGLAQIATKPITTHYHNSSYHHSNSSSMYQNLTEHFKHLTK